MSPRRILEEAQAKNLDIIALTDHNTALNCPTLLSLAKNTNIVVFPGLEITSREEVHILALFEHLEEALDMGQWIYPSLTEFPYDAEKYGDQVYVDENEVILGEVSVYLGQACSYTLEEIVDTIHQHNGLAIPSHIDRPGSGLLDNLGFLLPQEKTRFDAIELSRYYWLSPFPIPNKEDYPCLSSSDAHFPEAIGTLVSTIDTEEKSWQGFCKALHERQIKAGIFPSNI
ncbi:PHP-associated domain-containing protein [Thermospira aquatica]